MPRSRRSRRPREPRRVERRYERTLVRLVRQMRVLVDRTVQPHVERARLREDAEIDASLFGFDFGILRVAIARLVRAARLSPLVDRWGREIRDVNRRELERVLRIDLAEESAETRALLDDLRRANVALIQSIADRYLADVFRVVTESAINGTRVEVLAEQIQERHRVSASRDRLMGRDQTLKANAQLTRARHAEAGVDRYVWSSSRDERVRDRHRDLDGRTFAWSDPPVMNERGERGHPGQDIQCRCVAIPVLDS